MPTSPTSPTSTPFPLNEADVPNLSDLTIKVPPLLDIGELHLGLLSPISQSTVDEAVLQMLQIEDSGDRILGLAKNKLPATNRKRKRDHPPAPNPHRFIDRETEVREYLETNPEGHWSDALSPEQLIACCPNATDDQVISGAFTFAGEDINGNPLCRRLTFVGSALKKLSLGEKILHGLDLPWGVDFSEFQKKAKERFPDEQSRFNFWKSCIDEVVQNQLTDEAKKSAKKDFRGIPWRLNAYVDALQVRGHFAPSRANGFKGGDECSILMHRDPPTPWTVTKRPPSPSSGEDEGDSWLFFSSSDEIASLRSVSQSPLPEGLRGAAF